MGPIPDKETLSPAKSSFMLESETLQGPDEAQGSLKVPGFYVGPQSSDMRDL